jgi:hypothetical protein
MTKSETREVEKTIAHSAVLGLDYMARALSALYRSARSAKSQREIATVAYQYRAHLSSEWIIG